MIYATTRTAPYRSNCLAPDSAVSRNADVARRFEITRIWAGSICHGAKAETAGSVRNGWKSVRQGTWSDLRVLVNVATATLLNRMLRVPLKAAHAVMKMRWFVSRPRTFGAHAVALTSAGRVVLVKLRYADGWRLPGGGRGESEAPEDAVRRELREEIGMTACGEVQPVRDLEESTDFKRDLASLLIVRDVEYEPRKWSWEVEDVLETDLNDLPADLSPQSASWLRAVRRML